MWHTKTTKMLLSKDMIRVWAYRETPYLQHHGVKGMRWGVRKRDFSSGSSHAKIGLQFFAKKASEFKTLRLPATEYAHVMSEVATHTSKEQRQMASFKKCIGKYVYTLANNFDGTFRVIGKALITDKYKRKG